MFYDKKYFSISKISILFLFFWFGGFAQTARIDSLKIIVNSVNEDTNKVVNLMKLTKALRNSGNIEELMVFSNQMLILSEKLKFHKGITESYNLIGLVYKKQGNYDKAIEYYLMAMKLKEEKGDKRGVAAIFNNIGNIYVLQENNIKALEYHFKALEVRKTIGEQTEIATSYNNIGTLYNMEGQFDKALPYLEHSLTIWIALGEKSGIADAYNNIGNIHEYIGAETLKKGDVKNSNIEFDKALTYQLKALKIKEELQEEYGIANCNGNIGNIYSKQKKFSEALPKYLKALEIFKKLGDKNAQSEVYENMAILYEKTGDFKMAFQYQKQFTVIKDTLFNIENSRQLNEMNTKYETEKKDKELLLKDVEITKKDAESVKQQAQRNVFIVGFGLVLLLAIFIFRGYRQKQKANVVITKQKEEVEKQKHIIEEQKEIVEEKQKEIVDSITYAKRLQEAILPSHADFKKNLPESFLLYLPKDIVAGDFYWMEKVGDTILVAAADSTGHGVPGAMVSVVCSNALNRTVLEFHITEPGKILDKARELVIQTFEKSGEEVKDGMDISLASINLKTRKVSWAGAHNPLWYQSNNEMIDLTANKQPIGKSDHFIPFTTHELQLSKGDCLYLFTDGYADQFGGPKGKKYKYAPLKNLLLQTTSLSPENQKKELEINFENWKGTLEQVDDVCIIGIRL